MTKIKVRIKDIRSYEDDMPVIALGYCECPYLFRNYDPMFYTSGSYGWNFDTYILFGVVFSTGYRYMPGRRINSDIINEYEYSARVIWSMDCLTYQEKCRRVETLLKGLCDDIKEGRI